MTFVLQINGQSYTAAFEYTASAAVVPYDNFLTTLQNIVNQGGPGIPTSSIDTAFKNQYIAFKDALTNGILIGGQTKHWTQEMIEHAISLLQTFQALGINIENSSITDANFVAAMIRWKDIMIVDPSILVPIINASSSADSSIQAMMELDYVSTANEVLTNALESLEQQLSSTKSILDTFASLQNLYNQTVTTKLPAFGFSFPSQFTSATPNPTAWADAYSKAASAYFGLKIDPVLASDISIQGSVFAIHAWSAVAEFLRIRDTLKSTLASLDTVLNNEQKGPGTLYDKVKTVYGDMKGVGKADSTFGNQPLSDRPLPMDFLEFQANNRGIHATPFPYFYHAMQEWIIDSRNKNPISGIPSSSTSKLGGFRDRLTAAITAAQSTNSEQQDRIRQYLFLFQEYYQSASAVLNQLSQIITGMARSMKGN